jgi:FAD/FMN-containing dehydrogenase
MSVPAMVIFTLASLLNPNDSIEMAEAERLNERVVHRALSLEGTCTGEHMSVMRAIKKAIDPDNIMNPGKILRAYRLTTISVQGIQCGFFSMLC